VFIVACIAASRVSVANRAVGFAVGEPRRWCQGEGFSSTLSTPRLWLAVWTAILCVLLSVGGTLIMRKVGGDVAQMQGSATSTPDGLRLAPSADRQYQTPLALGYLLGVVLMMSQQCLILTAVFGGISDNDLDSEKAQAAGNAAAVFYFFLFVVYGGFGGLLMAFQHKLLESGKL
jgi:hypothetical protein